MSFDGAGDIVEHSTYEICLSCCDNDVGREEVVMEEDVVGVGAVLCIGGTEGLTREQASRP
jgi:hypothetical protein